MRIRFEIQSLRALGTGGVVRLPINCWRLTVQYTQDRAEPLLEGQSFFEDLEVQPGAPSITSLAQFTVGGVLLPDGTPVNLDQVLELNPNTRVLRGMLIYEYLEP